MEARTETNLAMNRVNIRFAGFTEGLPLFAVEIELNGLVARGLKSAGELDRLGLVIPETEERRMVDALHTWYQSGLCDDHLHRMSFSVR